ncbi:glycosyltransferase family 4 protein [Methanococcoides burtonii]|uniref:Glycosyl transferase, group I n=1 Tax=Methanococcoides burtonii (strain DSM 6242 / NBRC 107633 / OCM 468 / ACE-M) TaxID=259564 RepID=Q12UH3_METBU|nr:glycosyltransferase family 4 protein [Methanococcoides burtonii]ABE52903.1 Glycosyl transferase, group I [Methanococcoides burtonii DSM 6242]
MKIAIITNYWINSSGGGVKTYLTSLVDEFNNRDYLDVSVIFKSGKDYENYHIEGNKIVFVFKTFLNLKQLNPDIIHSQGTWYCLLPGYAYKKLYGTKLVHTFHSQPFGKLKLVGRIFFQTLLNGCDCITFVSKSLKKENERFGLIFNEYAITYAGVNSTEVSQKQIAEFSEKYNLKSSNYVLLAQGFMSNKLKAKGSTILIKALKHLLNKYPQTILVLTGDGAFSNEVKLFVEEVGLSENVIFTGHLSDPFVPLAICNIYTHISLADGVPLALLEAMAMGKPIMATNIGGIPEAIDNGINGILVEPCENQIYEGIEYLILNSDVATKMGYNAKQTVSNKFTWKNAANVFYDIYCDSHKSE